MVCCFKNSTNYLPFILKRGGLYIIDLNNYRLSDSKQKNNELLKFIAIVSMLICHIDMIFSLKIETFQIIGTIAFPIIAYKVAEGYQFTSNANKYMYRLWLFAIISQIPYSFVFDTFQLNVLFTLAIALFFMDRFAKKEYYWLPTLLFLLYFIDIQFYLYGVLLPIAFYFTRKNKIMAMVITGILIAINAYWIDSLILLFGLIGVGIALFLPKDKFPKLKISKYFFYWFYPIHLIILFIIKMFLIS